MLDFVNQLEPDGGLSAEDGRRVGVGGKPLTHMLDQHASNFTRPRLRVESERITAHRIGGVLGVTSRPPLGLPSQNPAGWPLRGFPIWSRV